MKHISKIQEPHSLKEFRSTPGVTFDNAPKSDIRHSLIEEQGGICAYCMQRISEEWDGNLNKYKMEIEHYRSQSRHPQLELNYSNMLGVCNGNAGFPKHKLHCDKKRPNLICI